MEQMPHRPEQKSNRNQTDERKNTQAQGNSIVLSSLSEAQSNVRRAAAAREERMRKRKHKRHVRLVAVLAVIAAGMLAYFTGLYGASLALLGDAVDSVTIALTPGKGFPIPFTLSGFQNALPLAGGFAAVGDKDLAIYSANGNEVRRIQHGYARASITAGSTRVCIYNRAGHELRVESRSRTLYEAKMEDPIQLCAMSPNGTLAVFTRGKLRVYDPMFEEIYGFKTQDLPTAMAFADDNRHFAAGVPYADQGILGGKVYLMDTRRSEYITISSKEGVPVRLQYLDGKKIMVIYDSFAAIYSTEDGTELSRYSYEGRTLQSIAFSEGRTPVLLFGDGVHSAMTELIILDSDLKEIGRAKVNANANRVAAGREGAFVLTNNSVLSYALDGVFCGKVETQTKPLALVRGRKTFLLGHNQVSVLEMPPRPENQRKT